MGEGVKITVTADTAAAAQKIEQFFGGLGKGLERLSGIGDFLGGIAASIVSAFSVDKLVEFTARAVESEAAMSKLSKETGISVETLAALRQAYIAAGGNAEEFNGRINIFTQRVGLAYRQGGQLAQVFRDMGVPIASASGQLLPMESILASVAGKLASLHDAASKADFGRELFGRDSHEIVQTLSEIGDNFAALKSKSPFTAEQAQAALDFQTKVKELKEQLGLLFTEFANHILPSLKQFVDWLSKTAEQNGWVTATAKTLTETFQTLEVVVDYISTLFETLGEIIGQGLGFAWEQAISGGRTFLEICRSFQNVIPALKDEMLSMVKVLGALAKAMVHAINHDFVSVATDIAPALADLGAKGQAVGDAISKGMVGAAIATHKFVMNSGADIHSFLDGTLADVGKKFAAFSERSIKTFGTFTAAGGAAPDKPKPAPPIENYSIDQGFPGPADATITQSDEAKRLMAEIDKQYAASTQGRIALLNLEEAKLKKECDDEIHDVTLREAEKTKIAQIYAKQREEVAQKEAKEKMDLEMAALKAHESLIKNDPDLSEAAKTTSQIQDLKTEIDDLTRRAAEVSRIMQSPGGNSDQKNEALKESVALTDLLAVKTSELNQLNAQNNIFEQMRQSLLKLTADWVNYAQQMGKVISGTVSTAVNSLSDNITKGIVGTERWSQVWKNIGVSIETEIIGAIVKMFVQLAIGMIAQAALGKTIAAAATLALVPIAAAQSAIWGTPATLAIISSYGGAAAAAPGQLAAALAEGKIIASIGGAATGGLIDGPGTGTSDSILMRLSKGEFVIPAHIVQSIGPEFFENLRSGAIGAQNLYGSVMSGLSRPVTSDSDVASQLPGLGGGGGNSKVNIEGHKVAIIQVKDKNEMRDALYEHSDHIVHIVTSNKKKIGIPT